jgi:hypothetical protein
MLRLRTPKGWKVLERVVNVLVSESWLSAGEMAEWLKAHAWKACIPQGIQGSNPCLSAIICSKPNTIN